MCFWRQAEFPAPFPSFPAAPEKSLCRVLMSRCGTNHTRSLVLNPVLEVEWSYCCMCGLDARSRCDGELREAGPCTMASLNGGEQEQMARSCAGLREGCWYSCFHNGRGGNCNCKWCACRVGRFVGRWWIGATASATTARGREEQARIRGSDTNEELVLLY